MVLTPPVTLYGIRCFIPALVSYMIRAMQRYIKNFVIQKTFRKKLDVQIDYTEEIRHIALKIKALRKERKLTVQELAYRCDIERSNLSRLETGRSNPTIKTLCIICNALDVPLRSLIE